MIGKLHPWVLLLLVGCAPKLATLEGRRCSEDGGECVAGYSCDRSTWICVAKAAPSCVEGEACGSGDPCRAGLCTDGACVKTPLADGTPCDDGAFCSENDACEGGVCVGTPRDCGPPGTPCTAMACNEEDDLCQSLPVADGSPCDDGLFCNEGESCTGGVCGGGGPRECSAVEDPCNGSRCNEAAGRCEAVALADTTACDDGDRCTGADHCASGQCAGTPMAVCGWSHRKAITLHAAQIAGDLQSFPVLIDLPADAQLAAGARSNGDDLLFTDASMNPLSHEIEIFDGSSGRLLAWVRVPKLSSTSDTLLYLHYANPAASRQEDAAGVWDANYVGIWHLQEEAAGASTPGLYRDSTAGGNHGDDGVSAVDKAGMIGNGQGFDGVDDLIDCGNDPSLDLDQLTIELWFRDSSWVDNAGVLARGTNTARRYWIWTWANDVSMEVDGGGIQDFAWSVASGQWVHLALTYDGAFVRTFLDGAPENTYPQASGIIDTTPEPLLLGLIPGFNYFGGHLDEVRISRAPRSPAWIQTAYQNQSAPAAFLSVGPEL